MASIEELRAQKAAKMAATAQKTSDIVAQQAGGEMSEVDLLRIIPSTQLVKDYADKTLPWVQKPFVLRGEVTILIGAANLGKTTFVLQMLMRGATGNPWFLSEKTGATFRSLYFSLEMGEHPLSIRLMQMFGGGHDNILTATPPALGLTDKTWDTIGRVVKAQNIDVVVIDNLLGMDLGFDLNKMQETSKLMNDARAFAQLYDVAVILIHHTRKGGSNDVNRFFNADTVLDEAAGSKVIVNRAGIRLFLQKRGNSRRLFVYSRFGPQRTIRLGWDKLNHLWRRSSRNEETGETGGDEVEDGVEDDAEVRIITAQKQEEMIPTNDTKLEDTPLEMTGNISSYQVSPLELKERINRLLVRGAITKDMAHWWIGCVGGNQHDLIAQGVADVESKLTPGKEASP